MTTNALWRLFARLTLALAIGLLLSFTVGSAQAQQRGIRGEAAATATPTPALASASRHYYALVVGNNDYQSLPKLKTAEGDAQALAALLHDQFGFRTTLLLNATRAQIIAALNAYRKDLDDGANLLIYYAGHGYNDAEVDKAYWLPVDAKLDDNANWISADDITTNTKGIHARHILIISDSCYSGTIVRDAQPTLAAPTERTRFLDKMDEGKSRTLMASGGNEPVADSGGNGHSVFANALLRGFTQIDKDKFTADEMFHDYVVENVAGSAEQTPEYSPIRNSGHESGDFIFIRTSAPTQTLAQTQTTTAAQPGATPKPAPSAATNGNAPMQTAANNTGARGLSLGQPASAAAASLPPNLNAAQYEQIAIGALDANQWAKAEAAFRAALRLPGCKMVDHANLAVALANQQKYTEAEAEARTGVRLRPNLAITHHRLAYVLTKQQKFADAEIERRAALQLDPVAKAHALLAHNLFRQGKLAEAETEARNAIQQRPNDAFFHDLLGLILREQKRLPDAVAEFREAVRLAPNNTQFLIDLNQALSAQKRQPQKN
jgi:tetratricopeptide (TPR) repeat protein